MPDKDGYPIKTELSQIKDWSYKDPLGLIEYIRNLWWHGESGVILKGKHVFRLELHTWGWFGNESIISALKKSSFWQLWWRQSRRGGHYSFKIKKVKI